MVETSTDTWHAYDVELSSRLLVGTALYPSPAVMEDAIRTAEGEIITVALRRQAPQSRGGQAFWQRLEGLGKRLLPNTAGCFRVEEAVMTAEMSRELFDTNWIKLEVMGDDYNLQPDPFGLVEAATELIQRGFAVFPYCTDDLVLCQRLLDAGCRVLMPGGAPIGTGKGLMNPYALRTLRERLPDVPLIVDAGLGLPSHAAAALEMGIDAVLLNTAIAKADDPVLMAAGFRDAVRAGRTAFRAGPMAPSDTAAPSTPTVGQPFWHEAEAKA